MMLQSDTLLSVNAATFEGFICALTEKFTSFFVDVSSLRPSLQRVASFDASSLEQLVFLYTQELLYLKDSDGFLPCSVTFVLQTVSDSYHFDVTFRGEDIDVKRHMLQGNVLAVTLQTFAFSSEQYTGTFMFDVSPSLEHF